ncbi:sugar transporter ERD6-like 5 [Quercus lobata]|uniref:sugar transporter ERD6-like 5 n=1 Tax=Quercus lobata TaxID=97700 RepID=UPI0012456AA1|nr:sugar transporter ERD6-like 5 [Quercus lobata]
MDDLGLTVAEYSLFGSILTIGAMMGAIVSGQIADYIGRRGTMGFSEIFCLARWLAIAFSKVLNPISLFYAVPNINVNVTCMTTPTFYLKRCLHKDNGNH